ncbi:nucleotidyltransferase family protein [Myxococcus sp. K38C18041901]|uniref:nucleotidyltransferase family protein n=1 Tax=Myxococcus guangdongensis TaxID=2906760 RepID=UPI0020A75517|nr:NTP transferase domain-containing protein [Myxococcus guangdongensis]MCP3063855.1 nucleotidyltransferase family protein [Myxococcus guangdongensis]
MNEPRSLGSKSGAETRVGVVLLAAGGSSRLGHPKQLVVHEGKTLIRRAAEAALSLGEGPVLVVLGAHRDTIVSELVDLPLRVIEHPEWALGPGGSLTTGLSAMLSVAPSDAPDVGAVLFMLCDQVRVTSAHLRALVDTWRTTGASIVASGYDGTHGVPALFSRAVFPELEALTAAQGARGVIAREPTRVATVPLPGGGEDVDTPLDLARLNPRRPA